MISSFSVLAIAWSVLVAAAAVLVIVLLVLACRVLVALHRNMLVTRRLNELRTELLIADNETLDGL